MASNLKVDIVRPTATNGSLSLKGDSGGSATTNGVTVNSSGNTSITGTTTVSSLVATTGTFTTFTSTGIDDNASTTALTIDSSGNVTLEEDATINGITVGKGSGTAIDNTAVGTNALAANSSGSENAAYGYQALLNNTTGSANTAHGVNALISNTTGSSNTAVGRTALNSNDGDNNTAQGVSALGSNTSGSNNTAIGYSSGSAITTGSKNTIIGCYSGNQGGLDIRTSSNNIVLSDGDGNPRAHIDSSGNVELKTTNAKLILPSGGGIDFGVSTTGTGTVTPTVGGVLDDYEEGTWTPQLTDNQSTPNEFSYADTPTGKYTKIGDLVTVFFQARTDGSTSGITTSDQLYMRSLPFINESTSPAINAYSIVRMSVLNTNQSTIGPVFARLNFGADSVRFEHQFGDLTSPYSIQTLSISEFESGSGAEVQGSLTYKTT